MKKSLLIISLLATALAACSSDQEKARYKEAEAKREEVFPIVAEAPGYYVNKVCIEGVSYLTYSRTIILQVDSDNHPIACKVPNAKAAN